MVIFYIVNMRKEIKKKKWMLYLSVILGSAIQSWQKQTYVNFTK